MNLEYALVDLDAVRAAELIPAAIRQNREQVNRDKVTSFTWLTLDECAAAGSLIEVGFTSTGWSAARPRAAEDVPWPRRTTNWLCDDCRCQVALRDGVCGACWLRRWKESGGE